MTRSKQINIPIMFCFDTNYVIPAGVAFYSLLEHANPKYNYTFYVLHSDITDKQQEKLHETIKQFKNCELKFINMNHKLDDFWDKYYTGDHFSKEVMYKLLVASTFPNIDKIIVSDVDVVFLGDISESYFFLTDDDDAYIAGVKPISKISNFFDNYKGKWTEEEISHLGNVCGGYLVMNLKKIREDNYEQVFMDSLAENGPRLIQMEQDIFNITCYNHMKRLDLNYIVCSYMWDIYKTDEDFKTDTNYTKTQIKNAMQHPIQLHYATGIKPWKNPDCTKGEIWYEYLCKTPFIKDHLLNLAKIINEPSQTVIQKKDSVLKRGFKLVFRTIKKIIKNPKMLFTKDFYVKIYNKICRVLNIKKKH